MKLDTARTLCLLVSIAVAGPAHAAGTFYGASPVTGELFTIDVNTGAGTLVAALPSLCLGGTGNAVTEIEFSNLSRRAFAQCQDGSFDGYEVNLTTGAAIGGVVPNGSSFNGLETVGGTWYGTSITGPQGPSELRTLDPFTGASTLVGATGVGPIAGIAHDKRSGIVYGIAGGPGPANLYTINLATGAATVVGSTGIQAGSLEFGPDGRLYAGGTGLVDQGKLFVIDPRTGASTLLGPTGFGSISSLTLVEPDCNNPSNPFLNCGFEMGNFTSWVTQDMTTPFFALQVGGAGITPGFGLFTSDPTEGTLAALHGFDGDGPGHIRVAQDIAVPGGGLLEFDYRGGWDLMTFCVGCVDRSFDVLVEPAGGGAPLATVHILTAVAGTFVPDTGDQVGQVNLGAFAGQTVRVAFDWFVPENLTGPAFFQLDNVRVDVPNGFFTVTPCRLIDTRNPNGPLAGPALNAGADRPFTLVGSCGIPMSAKAVSVNIAVTGATATGNLRLHPGGTAVPLVSSINYGAGQTRSNNAIVPLNAAGQIAAFAGQATGTVNLILDVNGYFQ